MCGLWGRGNWVWGTWSHQFCWGRASDTSTGRLCWPEHQGQFSWSSAWCNLWLEAEAGCRRIPACQIHTWWIGNLLVLPWFKCCWWGSHLYYPGSTWRGLLVTGPVGKGYRKDCRTFYDWACGSRTACQENDLCGILSVYWQISWGSGSLFSGFIMTVLWLPMLFCLHKAV